MNLNSRILSEPPRVVLCFVLLGMIMLELPMPMNPQSASALVSTFRRSPVASPGVASFGCGSATERSYRLVALKLAKMGGAAAGAIDEALNSLELEGEESDYNLSAWWVLHLYAKVHGTSAVPALLRMERDGRHEVLRFGIDDSIALALGLTSFVSEGGTAPAAVACRGSEPKDPLNRIIGAFETDDDSMFENSLSEDALAAIRAAFSNQSLRKALQTSLQGGIGYRFLLQGKWGEPEEALRTDGEKQEPLEYGDEFVLRTEFVKAAGAVCGSVSVQFSRKARPDYSSMYLINDSHLPGLLQTVASCLER